MLLIAGMVFTIIFYVAPLASLMVDHPVFRVAGRSTPAVIIFCAAAYLLIVVVLLCLKLLQEGLNLNVSEFYKDVKRRTGLTRVDWVGSGLSVAVLVIAIFGVKFQFLPLGLAGLAAFGPLLFTKVELREVDRGGTTMPAPEPTVPAEVPGEAGEVEVPYSWGLRRNKIEDPIGQAMTLSISTDRYERLRKDNPSRRGLPGELRALMAVCISQAKTVTPEVTSACTEFASMSQSNRFSNFLEISNVLCFTQEAIDYVEDEASTGIQEYFRYPIETLYEKGGDCECKSILAAAILNNMGYDVALLLVYREGKADPDHSALGIEGANGIPGDFCHIGNSRYYFCETTATGWMVGEVPPDIDKVLPFTIRR